MWSLNFSIFVFPVSAIIICLSGVKVVKYAEFLSEKIGIGQSLFGAIFVGVITSLAGLVTSISVAYQNHPSFAVTNSLGGIAFQTVSLSLADLSYRPANLEHAAASESNLVQTIFLILLLTIPLYASTVTNFSFLNISPFSIILVITYIFGIKIVSQSFKNPMWTPKKTNETHIEQMDQKQKSSKQLSKHWTVLIFLSSILSLSGWCLGQAGISLAIHSHLKESLVGGVLTGITSSLPELVIAITAVRRNALNLAIGNVIGGNMFDVLFIGISDAFYLNGSIYAVLNKSDFFWIALDIILSCILLMGLIRREKHGIANIGYESALIIIVYLLSFIFI